MKIAFLDNITGFGEKDWTKPWVVGWFAVGVLALFLGFWQTTEHGLWDWIYLGVSYVGLLCVVGLSFRKSISGNGFGVLATLGEVFVQARAGAIGLALAPLFNCFSHAYGMYFWSKNTDSDGDMLPKSANKYVWLVTFGFIVLGVSCFGMINEWLSQKNFAIYQDDGSKFLGLVSFYWINVLAFVLSVTAQATMIMRYSFNWYLWILVNFVWLIVNLTTGNYIFAIQTVVYQVNSVVGLYGWHRSEQQNRS